MEIYTQLLIEIGKSEKREHVTGIAAQSVLRAYRIITTGIQEENELLQSTQWRLFYLLFEYVLHISDTFFVGPLFAKPSKELPEDLEEFMQSYGEHGVVLIAF